MKKPSIAAARVAACLASAAIAAGAVASVMQAAPGAPAMAFKCAVYEGDPGIRRHTASEVRGRTCESYWVDDTVEDARELAAARPR